MSRTPLSASVTPTCSSTSSAVPVMHSSPLIPRIDSRHLFEHRLQTFEHWPLKFIDPKLCAASGLCYLNVADETQCVFCDVVIKGWKVGDCVFEMHSARTPYCSHLHDMNFYSIDDPLVRWQLETYMPSTKPKFPAFAKFDERIKTFRNWKFASPDAQSLCEAGFFLKMNPDLMQCFHCGLLTASWDIHDVPFVEHARHSPSCDFVHAIKGSEYVRNAKDTYENILKMNQLRDLVLYETNDETVCRICFEKKSRYLVYPCSHYFACKDCLQHLALCPLCREPIRSILPVFSS